MDWVDGVTLDNYIPESEKAKNDFRKLINNYKTMSSWLLEQSFCHGDISPKNIVITKDNNILLIDYDNVVFSDEEIPVSTNKMKDENFCNPCQTSFKYENNIDNFSLVSIMISLIYEYESISKTWERDGGYIIIMEKCLFSKRRTIQIWIKAIFLKELTNAFLWSTN